MQIIFEGATLLELLIHSFAVEFLHGTTNLSEGFCIAVVYYFLEERSGWTFNIDLVYAWT
jgi:hypothetical protein